MNFARETDKKTAYSTLQELQEIVEETMLPKHNMKFHKRVQADGV